MLLNSLLERSDAWGSARIGSGSPSLTLDGNVASGSGGVGLFLLDLAGGGAGGGVDVLRFDCRSVLSLVEGLRVSGMVWDSGQCCERRLPLFEYTGFTRLDLKLIWIQNYLGVLTSFPLDARYGTASVTSTGGDSWLLVRANMKASNHRTIETAAKPRFEPMRRQASAGHVTFSLGRTLPFCRFPVAASSSTGVVARPRITKSSKPQTARACISRSDSCMSTRCISISAAMAAGVSTLPNPSFALPKMFLLLRKRRSGLGWFGSGTVLKAVKLLHAFT
jgi:hypothetical protein